MIAVDDEAIEKYLAAARAGDHRTATALVVDLLHDGIPPDVIIGHLLVVAQERTGQRWWRNEWTVADEHLVTTTTAAAVEALSSASTLRSNAGHLVVVCAEGDWHGLPGRLFSERMRDRGWRVSFLGASTPADHVAEFLTRTDHDALAITCAVPLTFAGAARLADVGHEAGLPVLIGGAAVAPNPDRALALGADVLVSSPDEADAALRDMAGTPVLRSPVKLPWTAFQVEADAAAIGRAAFEDLQDAFPGMKGYDERQRQRTVEDLVYMVRFVAAAILVADRTVWWDFDEWQRALLAARGVPESAFDAAIAILGDHMEERHPVAARVLTMEARRPSE